MKKKLLLIIGMFLFITNVSALTFDVNVTSIEDKGSGSLGTIKKIDLEKKEVDAFFEEIGAEVNFDVTVTNLGDRAGTLREITVTGTSENFEYTTNLPEGGLAIDENGANTITITGRVKDGATNGKTSSEIKIKYNYDEGSCPEGEILSDDESMCLCPTGKVRTDSGKCEEPAKPVECEKDEVFNTHTKQCEKKVVPVVPVNPKTLDNIVLITLLFIVSGLGIYAVMFKRLKTKKKKVTAGVITGVATLGLSFTVLASIFGIDNLLGAIINPITKSKELTIKVNEEIELIETWDGTCELEVAALTPENIFEGGSGTEDDPYQIKTAEQLGCFAKSVNNGTTYQGKYIKQTKTIKLNDDLNNKIANNTTNGLHPWTPAGYSYEETENWTKIASGFNGTYNGDNYPISGLYIVHPSVEGTDYNFAGLFGYAESATFKNMRLTDVYIDSHGYTGALLGSAYKDLTVSNVSTYGNAKYSNGSASVTAGAGIIARYDINTWPDPEYAGVLKIEDTTNNINISAISDYGRYSSGIGGILGRIERNVNSDTPNIIFRNVTNNGNITVSKSASGIGGILGYTGTYNGNYVIDKCVNTGDLEFKDLGTRQYGGVGGLFGYLQVNKLSITNTHNEGDIFGFKAIGGVGGIGGTTTAMVTFVDNTYNSGNITSNGEIDSDGETGAAGIFGTATRQDGTIDIRNSFNTGDIYVTHNQYAAGIIGKQENMGASDDRTITNCYNTGDVTAIYGAAGIVGQMGGKIYNSYNTGAIYSRTNRAGGLVGYGGSSVYNSYNEGTVSIYAGGSAIGGICGVSCDEIKNSYNRGDVIVLIQCDNAGGIIGQAGGDSISNSYNSGNVIAKGPAPASLGGIGCDEGTFSHVYNQGSIIKEAIGAPLTAGGITVFGNVSDSVNAGDIKQVINTQLSSGITMNVGGISYYMSTYGTFTRNFNAGLIKVVNPDGTDYAIATDGFSHTLRNGEIVSSVYGDITGSLNNKFNTNQNGKAIGDSSRSETENTYIGTYTTESTPDILSIINGDDAFEIKEGDTLPTLKVFNQ